MAQHQLVTVHCDVDGAEVGDGEHVTRAVMVDGRAYEADVCRAHSADLDAFLGRLRPGQGKGARGSRHRGAEDRRRAAGIRAWALCNGIEVEARGRIPADVVAQYEAAEERG